MTQWVARLGLPMAVVLFAGCGDPDELRDGWGGLAVIPGIVGADDAEGNPVLDVGAAATVQLRGDDLQVRSLDPDVVVVSLLEEPVEGCSSSPCFGTWLELNAVSEGDTELVVARGEEERHLGVRVRRPSTVLVFANGERVSEVVIDEYEVHNYVFFGECSFGLTRISANFLHAGSRVITSAAWTLEDTEIARLAPYHPDFGELLVDGCQDLVPFPQGGSFRTYSLISILGCAPGDALVTVTTVGGSSWEIPVRIEVERAPFCED